MINILWIPFKSLIIFQEVYQVHLTGDKCIASMVCHHDTGSMAIMNSDNFYDGRNHTLAVGMDDECHIYNLKYKVVSPNKAKGNLFNC